MIQTLPFPSLNAFQSEASHVDRCACPACDCIGEMRFIGTQRWSEAVAKAAGLPITMRLWTCECCGTTVSEARLKG